MYVKDLSLGRMGPGDVGPSFLGLKATSFGMREP